jgi:hypothetical protein
VQLIGSVTGFASPRTVLMVGLLAIAAYIQSRNAAPTRGGAGAAAAILGGGGSGGGAAGRPAAAGNTVGAGAGSGSSNPQQRPRHQYGRIAGLHDSSTTGSGDPS